MMEPVRHLTEPQAAGALDRGRTIEQLLASDSTAIEWLRLSVRSSGVTLIRHRVRDVGGDDFKDVYEFPPIDPEEEHGEGTVLATFADGDEALAGSVDHGARVDRWVSDGMIQDEYADATNTEG
jgi:hypothetical protein